MLPDSPFRPVCSDQGHVLHAPLFSLSPSSGWEPFVSEDSPLLWTTESQSFLSSVLTHFIHFLSPCPPLPRLPLLGPPQHLDGIGAEEISSISWRSGWHCLPCPLLRCSWGWPWCLEATADHHSEPGGVPSVYLLPATSRLRLQAPEICLINFSSVSDGQDGKRKKPFI